MKKIVKYKVISKDELKEDDILGIYPKVESLKHKLFVCKIQKNNQTSCIFSDLSTSTVLSLRFILEENDVVKLKSNRTALQFLLGSLSVEEISIVSNEKEYINIQDITNDHIIGLIKNGKKHIVVNFRNKSVPVDIFQLEEYNGEFISRYTKYYGSAELLLYDKLDDDSKAYVFENKNELNKWLINEL